LNAVLTVFCLFFGIFSFGLGVIGSGIALLWLVLDFLKAPIGIKGNPMPDILVALQWSGLAALLLGVGVMWLGLKLVEDDTERRNLPGSR